MNPTHQATCPVCESTDWKDFFKMSEIPIYCNIFQTDREAARNCSRGDIQLAFCSNCGFIGNSTFDVTQLEYTQQYENALDFSPRFQKYAQSLAARLVTQHNLYDKDIVEIGCGKGEFLISLCDLGNNRGVGFDPTYVALPEHDRMKGQVKFIQDLYSTKYADYPADFICCRHTLEHIQTPIELLESVRLAIGDKSETPIFFEVPNGLDTFENLSVWDIIYEHCCYFTPVSLAYAFAACGFTVNAIFEDFQHQFLCIEATPGEPVRAITSKQAQQVSELSHNISTFMTRFQRKVQMWQEQLQEICAEKKKIVVWGAGSKGVMFLNLLQMQEDIEYIVDINPRKHGMFVAGTGQKIVPPKFLQEYQPDVVIVMNSVYEDEIKSTCRELGLNSSFLTHL